MWSYVREACAREASIIKGVNDRRVGNPPLGQPRADGLPYQWGSGGMKGTYETCITAAETILEAQDRD